MGNQPLPFTLTYPNPLPAGPKAVAIGNFDGVHAGHRHLLATARTEAEKYNLPLVALTFEPPPRTLLQPNIQLHRLTTPEQKIHLLHQQHANVAILPFTPQTAAMSPQSFIDDILINWLQAQIITIGENFRFGHKGTGDVSLLKSQTKFTTLAIPLHADEHGPISSTRLRITP